MSYFHYEVKREFKNSVVSKEQIEKANKQCPGRFRFEDGNPVEIFCIDSELNPESFLKEEQKKINSSDKFRGNVKVYIVSVEQRQYADEALDACSHDEDLQDRPVKTKYSDRWSQIYSDTKKYGGMFE